MAGATVEAGMRGRGDRRDSARVEVDGDLGVALKTLNLRIEWPQPELRRRQHFISRSELRRRALLRAWRRAHRNTMRRSH